ncbi:hypothetical protein B0H13DRAFT_2326292 [Mycena leptocephala]|nr:hypothetical protein B0H13DRAFT_2326292 [Mycena leptocephala]
MCVKYKHVADGPSECPPALDAPPLIATDARRSPVHQCEVLRGKEMKGLTFDEMPKHWGLDEVCITAAFCGLAKFTPEELNFVGILDDGADSPFLLSLQGPLGEH